MVGCVIVCNGKIIGKGFHEQYGEAHAEVNAIKSVKKQELLKQSTLYVNLEPCAHFGKTPPCVDLIIEKQIPHVVIGSIDPNPLVSGKGIEKLRAAGIKVETGILEKENVKLNKRFFNFHTKKRPNITLKWAQTKDGFIDKNRGADEVGLQLKISGDAGNKLAHQWRSHHQGILIGTKTALMDNPRLSVRLAEGKNPVRIVIDKELKIPTDYHLLDGSIPTIVFTHQKKEKTKNIEYITAPKSDSMLSFIMDELYKKNIQSVLVEGGAEVHTSFIQQNMWDEAFVLISKKEIQKGVKAPLINKRARHTSKIDGDAVNLYFNK